MNRDEEHLRLLSIFYYVIAGFNVMGACFFGVYIILGIFALVAPFTMGAPGSHSDDIPAIVFIIIGLCGSLFIAALAGLNIFVGRSLSRKKLYSFCLVMAGISCVFFPLGTVLGVFSLIVLARPTVKALFDGNIPPAFPR
jgi:hypothetical protein